ncbi:MAG: hypothetical protein Q8Q03_02725 [bacterium]|nr:hypothetical protein [bacterium]
MEHLSKQQIILLTLLVSFVTSIATGIVTVSLMDQDPIGVTQTINRVVERTIERVSDPSGDNKTAAVINIEDATASAVEKVSKSTVRIKEQSGGMDAVTGLGLIVSKDGVIVTDKASIAPLNNPVAVFHDGQQFPIHVIQSQIDGDVVFVVSSNPVINHADFSSSLKLGQAILSLSGKDSYFLSHGIYQGTEGDEVITSVRTEETMIGSPGFSFNGEIIGFKTSSLMRKNSFHSLDSLRASIPRLYR